MENRISSGLPSMPRCFPTFSHGDMMMNSLQFLPFDTKPMAVDQKFPRQGELKRVITSALGISSDNPSHVAYNGKPLPPSSLADLRRVKASLHESSIKARDRVKTLDEAISKFEKYSQSVQFRKRSRSDVSLTERSNGMLPGGSVPGGTMAKMGSQSHLTSSTFELGPQKSEDRSKNGVPNKRIRTSMVDMDARANDLPRPSVPIDRDRDMLRPVNGSTTQSEEKGFTLPTGVDGWEKMRKKRSGIKSDVSPSVVVAKPLDGDREPKRGMQQRVGNDARSRLGLVRGFRSGPVTGAVGVEKLEVTSQQNGPGMCCTPRSDQEMVSRPNDRRDRLVASDKERVTPKAVSKTSIRDDNTAAIPTPVTKMHANMRAPRSSSATLPKSSTNTHRITGTSDDCENPQKITGTSEYSPNTLHAVVGANNRKRSASMRSSSPPVPPWVGQRPQKLSRVARRTNFGPLVSTHDDSPASDTVTFVPGTDIALGFPRRLSSNDSEQVKLKVEHISSVGLSASQDPGAAENKSKDKGKKCGEIDEKGGPSIQKEKGATLALPPRKNRVSTDEHLGDVVRRRGRTEQGFAPTRPGTPSTMDKLDNAVTAKQLRSARLGSDKIESKPGRPPSKKLSERKAYTRPRDTVNNGSSDLAGESDDDHDELLAAANAALNNSNTCSSSFWKQIEPVFRFVSAEDITFIKQQICLADESDMNIRGQCDTDPKLKGDVGCNLLPSGPALVGRADCRNVTNGIDLDECKSIHEGIPLSLRIIAAGIEITEIEDFYCGTSQVNDRFKYDNYGVGIELDREFKSKSSNKMSLKNFPTLGRTVSNGYRVTATKRYHDELDFEELEYDDVTADSNIEIVSKFGHGLIELLPKQAVNSSPVFSEFQYDQMCLDDRILLELQSIGLSPESLPDLAQGEDDEISDDISRLEDKLREQVLRKKRLLVKLEKAVMDEREHQEREIERLALDKLVGMAYDKYMACWGPNVAGGKSASNKIIKRAAFASVKRALARCQKFVDTGKSCFSEPPFRDMFLSVSSHSNGAECIDIITEREAAIPFADTSTHSSEIRVSAPLGSDDTPALIPQSSPKIDHEKYSPDDFRLVNPLSAQNFGIEDSSSNRVKKRELLLDDIVGSAAGTSLGSSLLSGTKGKRSERDREGKGHNREAPSKNATAKIGRPALSNAKGERKTKTKPKQKTTQLSAPVNGFLGKVSELPTTTLPPVSKSYQKVTDANTKEGTSNDTEQIDLSHLQLPGIDILSDDLNGQGQDLDTWLSIDDDALPEDDFEGLRIPMDDLSGLNMTV
ncbi:serine/arginine repetitive matrix protein isoform X2 [Tasmannia lanceolata]|uniref:serine/arginine repetitive matrix protein isoform X2 n=1 Tax=Tasmannia lanceolata TaxID=3420 RepID=UPI0040638E7E